MTGRILIGNRLSWLNQLTSESIDLIYVRPIISGELAVPEHGSFEKSQKHVPELDIEAHLAALAPIVRAAFRVLSSHGTMYFHVDYQLVHYYKAQLLDVIFGRSNFINEIIWWTDAKASRSKRMWQTKHDYILVYVKDVANYTFNVDDIERIPYMAPSLVGPEKAELGKLPTDTWLNLEGVADVVTRIVKASSNPGDVVLDFHAGNGITGEVCLNLGRRFILIESDTDAMQEFVTKAKTIPGIEVTVNAS